jgi:hypothetical protein
MIMRTIALVNRLIGGEIREKDGEGQGNNRKRAIIGCK